MMQQISCILVAFICLFRAGGCQLAPETTEQYWLPDEDGVPHLVNQIEAEASFSVLDLDTDITFQLYTSSHPYTFLPLMPSDDVSVGDFNSSRRTSIIIHGWIGTPEAVASIRKAYIDRGDYNVIMVDWSIPAFTNYFLAKDLGKKVGEHVAEFIDFMVRRHNLRLEDVHIIGHSLGAQVAGIAGSNIKTGKAGRITGLDPAMPLFADEALENRLDSSDAEFVEVIHTNVGVMGWTDLLGHVDFYPNEGGPIQPGCEWNILAFTCSHIRAVEFFAESIRTPSGFVSYKCFNWDLYRDGKCFRNSRVHMGEFTNTSSRGMYFLKTAAAFPFALGDA